MQRETQKERTILCKYDPVEVSLIIFVVYTIFYIQFTVMRPGIKSEKIKETKKTFSLFIHGLLYNIYKCKFFSYKVKNFRNSVVYLELKFEKI